MDLQNKVRDAFDCVKADEELKNSTKAFLQKARQRESRRMPAFPLAAACALLTVFLCIGSYVLLWMPVAYVSIDVNPSLELELNRLDRVISVRAYNEDGERIAGTVSVKGMPYEKAIETIVDSEEMQPYLTQDAALTFTVATDSPGKEERLLSEIAQSHGCVDHGGISVRADISLVGEAHGNGLSLGKYLVYQLLLEYDPSVTVQDCHDMSMSELHGRLEEHEHGANHGGGHGEDHGSQDKYENAIESEPEYEIENQNTQSTQEPSEQPMEESQGHHREDSHEGKHGHGH